METFPGDPEESTDDLTGEKSKSKRKTLKTRLFGRKKGEEGGEGTLSHSANDITLGDSLGSAEDLVHPQGGGLGSRALSHDSIFQAEQEVSAPEPSRVLSQENVHSKIKALQDKLQLQNMRLGMPPLVVPIKRQEDGGVPSEDNGLPDSPREVAASQPVSPPLSPPIMSLAPSLAAPSQLPPAKGVPPADFSSLAQFTPVLDNSAARHRMSVKPRNQRATAKGRRMNKNDSRPRSESLHNMDRPVSTKDEDVSGDQMKRLRSHSDHLLRAGVGVSVASIAPPGSPVKTPELTPLRSAPTNSPVSPSSSSVIQTTPPEDVIPKPVPSAVPPTSEPPKPHKPLDLTSGKQPQPSPALPKPETRTRGEVTGASPAERDLKAASAPPPAPAKSGEPESNPDPETEKKDPTRRPSAGLSAVITFKTSSVRRSSQERAGQGKVAWPPLDKDESPAQTTSTEPESAPDSIKPKHEPSPRPFTNLSSVVAFKTSSMRRDSQEKAAQGKVAWPPVGQEDPARVEVGAGGGMQRGGSLKFSINSARRPPGGQDDTAQAEQGAVGGMQRGGSLKFSINSSRSDQGRPRAGSFKAVVEQAEAGLRTKTAEVESRAEVEEAMEVKEEGEQKEEEAKTAFGVKLRATNLSLKKRTEVAGGGQSDPKVKRFNAEGGQASPPVASADPKASPLSMDQTDIVVKKTNSSNTMATLSSQPGCDLRTAAQPISSSNTASTAVKTPASVTPSTPSAPRDEQARQTIQTGPQTTPQTNAQSNPPATPQTPSQTATQTGPQTTPQTNPQTPPQSAPQAEVSWMSIAMMKGRTLHSLITSRLPKDFPGMAASAPTPQETTEKQADSQSDTQTLAKPQTQAESQGMAPGGTKTGTKSQAEPQSPTAKQFPATDAVKVPETLTSGQRFTAKQPESPLVQLKTTPQSTTPTAQTISDASDKPPWARNETQIPKEGNPRSVQPTSTPPSGSQQPNVRTTHPLVRSLLQTRGETPAQVSSSPLSSSPKSSPNVPSWSSRGVSSNLYPKPTTSSQGSTSSPGPSEAPSETQSQTQSQTPTQAPSKTQSQTPSQAPSEVQSQAPSQTQTPSHSSPQGPARAVEPAVASPRRGLVGERAAAFLGKQNSEWTAPCGTKVELRRTATIAPESTEPAKPGLESSISAKPTLANTVKPESSPTKIPGRLADREDNMWLRKTMASSSSPSSSPTPSSPLQNISNSGQPSWMELAKRKSMAWGDKTLD